MGGTSALLALLTVVLCSAQALGATEGWENRHIVERSLLEGREGDRDMWQGEQDWGLGRGGEM